MEIAKKILIVIYFIIATIVIILALIQSKEDQGLSSTITGSSTDNFYEKNKGRTKEGRMKIAKGILMVIYFIVALALIILTLIQTKEDAGLSSTITGSSTSNFFEKNKGRTKEGKQKRVLVTLTVVFFILTVALGIIYMA